MRFEPSTEQLVLYIRGRLDPATADQVRTHLATRCRGCEAQMEWIQDLLEAVRRDPAETPPTSMIAAGERIFADQQRRRVETNPKVRHGILMFDSAWVPLPAGARAPASGQRRLLFAAEPFEVDLEISRLHHGSFDLLGQVSPADHVPPSSRVILQRRGKKLVNLDSRGMFAFERINPGLAGLTFQLGEHTIKLSRVRIG